MVEQNQPQEKEIETYAAFFDLLEGIKLIGTIQERTKTVGKLLDLIDSGYYHVVITGINWASLHFHQKDRKFEKDGVIYWFARQTVIGQAPSSFKDDMLNLVEIGETERELVEKREIIRQFKNYTFNFMIYNSSSTAIYYTYSNDQNLVEQRDQNTYAFWTFSLYR
ncbi:hypothetical protein FGO68_gene780 [Halteria grandinella]|uniref:Uncharacterized protein n=1 Tax=Halteria grandinella TaxID=5974 RepID=A0A8J8NII1_HALGN|nr:hypothetical protein FGO68_gene780 [Halteria grandinella]